MHTDIQTYRHTDIHTYIHIYNNIIAFWSVDRPRRWCCNSWLDYQREQVGASQLDRWVGFWKNTHTQQLFLTHQCIEHMIWNVYVYTCQEVQKWICGWRSFDYEGNVDTKPESMLRAHDNVWSLDKYRVSCQSYGGCSPTCQLPTSDSKWINFHHRRWEGTWT